jgi:diguanylate cyclase (GGDEF)-like protein
MRGSAVHEFSPNSLQRITGEHGMKELSMKAVPAGSAFPSWWKRRTRPADPLDAEVEAEAEKDGRQVLDASGHITGAAAAGTVYTGPVAAGSASEGTNTLTARLVLSIVRAKTGPEGQQRVLQRAGLLERRELTGAVPGRMSHSDKLRLFEEAAAELQDPRIGLLLGPEAMRDPALAPIRMLARSAGSPEALFNRISTLGSHFESSLLLTCLRSRPGRATIAAEMMAPAVANRIACDYTTSVLRQVPLLFGFSEASVSHSQCSLDGAEQCVFDVRWRRWGAPRFRRRSHDLALRANAARAWEQTDRRLHALEGAAGDLVSSRPVAETLDSIAVRAARAVVAAGQLLAVILPDGTRHVHTLGSGADLLSSLGEGVDFDTADPLLNDPSVLCLRIATAGRSYGVLAAVAGPGSSFQKDDAESLAAYARHAAAGLDIAGLLHEARQQGETAQLLLDVARSLSEVSSVHAVTRTIADAARGLSGAQRSAVAIWDPSSQQIRMAGMSGWSGKDAGKLAVYVTSSAESPELRELVESGVPVLVNRNGSAWAQHMLDYFELDALAAIPISSSGVLQAIVLAHWVEGAPRCLNAVLAERLSGLAGLASIALDNLRLLDEARAQALRDPLTGLPNRALLEERLAAALIDDSDSGRQVGVLFCDVNRFKRINDSLGHAAGDAVLQGVAGRLHLAVRKIDTVSRYSGDEFVVLLPDVSDRAEAELVAERIREALREPFDVAGGEIFVDAAIGSAVVSATASLDGEQSAAMARALLADADADMYERKARTRGALVRRVQDPQRLRRETELRGAVGRGEMRLHFQPQVDLSSNRVVAAEALVRWQHPTLGLLAPIHFIPLAEESTLIADIGRFVLVEACRTGAGWRAAGHELEISVNVSAVQLSTPGFASCVRDALAQTAFPAGQLTLEITEAQAVYEAASTECLLAELRDLGVGLSIDDFGTGYSSLAQLHRLPVSEVKIDRSFTARLETAEGAAFMAGVVGLGHGLGVQVVAEGVETAGQLRALKEMGCDRAQGFLLGRPVPGTVLERQLGRVAGTDSTVAWSLR